MNRPVLAGLNYVNIFFLFSYFGSALRVESFRIRWSAGLSMITHIPRSMSDWAFSFYTFYSYDHLLRCPRHVHILFMLSAAPSMASRHFFYRWYVKRIDSSNLLLLPQ
jgi:hypothetical protein